MRHKLMPYIRLMRLDKPIGILLLLWPTLSALWIAAQGLPDLPVLTVFVLGVIIMRSAGCVINDYADRHIDGLITRTQDRPLATGELSTRQALSLFCVLVFVAFILVLTLNKLTIYMAVAGLCLTVLYPFMKRYTYLPQVCLGVAFGWAIPMAFVAQTNTVPMIAWLLFTANVTWILAYDTFYAMADRDDDAKAGVRSSAVLFGNKDTMIIVILQVSFLLIMVQVGMILAMSAVYYLAIVLSAGLFIYQQRLVAARKTPAQCLAAFCNNNWVGVLLFLGIVVHYGW